MRFGSLKSSKNTREKNATSSCFHLTRSVIFRKMKFARVSLAFFLAFFLCFHSRFGHQHIGIKIGCEKARKNMREQIQNVGIFNHSKFKI